ncbi:MAG: hypothetical protein II644_00750 [Paludibacteraceae bacterium]|nr:hypothetical protein [Paludibacteraceae bacterium]
MNENYKIFPKIALWGTSIVSIIVVIVYAIMMFVVAPEDQLEVAGEFLAMPQFTGGYLIWAYALVGLAFLAFLVSITILLIDLFRKDAKKAIMVLVVIFTYMFIVPAICFVLANGDAVNIIGYEGTDNSGIWARISEMMLYWTYFAVAITLCAMGWGIVHKSINK